MDLTQSVTSTDIITSIGIILTFVISTWSLIISIKSSRKANFINSVTSSRIKYIQDIRGNIAEFCGLFYRYKLLLDATPELSNEKLEVLRSIDKLKYQIMLYLNPEEKIWDEKIIGLIEELRARINENPEDRIKDLIVLTQYLLKFEWEGAKLESRKGNLRQKKKEALSEKYFRQYLGNIH